MPFKFMRFFYHFYQTPAAMNPFLIPPPQAHYRPRSDGLPVAGIVHSQDAAAVKDVARVLRVSAGDAASTRAQFTAAVHESKRDEFKDRLKDLQKIFVHDVHAMDFDGWLYKMTREGRGGSALVGGAFLERVDAGWYRTRFRGACRAFWVVRHPNDDGELPSSGRAGQNAVWLSHMREMHGRLYALVERLARQQVFVLTAIGIRDEHRNRGLGSQLLQHIERDLGTNNVLVVVSDRHNQSFFARNGFEIADELGVNSPTMIMLKNSETPLIYSRGYR